MFKNYFRTAMRGLRKNKLFAAVNIIGLSLGLSCSILILLYVKDELSFDQWHKQGSHIFQLTCDRKGKGGGHEKFAIAAMVQGPAFKTAIPEIKAYVRVCPKQTIVRIDNKVFTDNITWVDESFFSVFSFPLTAGHPTTVLKDPHSIVLTETTARKYFGESPPVGKAIGIEVNGLFALFTVSGIAKEAPPNSSIRFNALLPFKYLEIVSPDNGWMWVSYPTYFLLRSDADPTLIGKKMDQVYQTQASEEIDMNHRAGYTDTFTWGLAPFTKMHLNKEFEGTPGASDPLYSYMLTGIALFILLIACINFINLTIARSLRRSKEIGIRKVLGGRRGQLIVQFLGETFLCCLFSFLLAFLLARLALPFFNTLSGKQLSLGYLFDIQLAAAFVGLFLLTGFMAGFYPALVLSAFQPVKTLYNRASAGLRSYLSKVLIVLQFSLATLLIVAVFFIYAQINFLKNADLGYKDKNLLSFVADKGISNKPLMDLLKAEITKVPGVEYAGYCNVGKFGGKTQAGGKDLDPFYCRVDENYLPALGAPITAGRDFSKAFPSDSVNSVLVNESFVQAAGWKDPIGKTVDFMNLPGWGDKKVFVIGVVKDYHFESLRENIRPQLFTMDQRLPLGRFIIRMNPANIPATIQAIDRTYHSLLPDQPLEYAFAEEENRKDLEPETKWGQMIGLGALLTVVISCIGLFGLVILSSEKRSREMGIRRVLGATSLQMVRLLCGEFASLVCIAFLIAMPLSWLAVREWLFNFAYRIEIHWWVFALAGVLIFLLAMITISFQSIKASRANPVDALRTTALLLAFVAAATAQQPAQTPAKPVKTGNEWKMPGDVFQRSSAYAANLKTKLSLDSTQTTKVYNAYLANTKPVDEISVLPDEDEKKAKLKANQAAFTETLKGIFTPAQFAKYRQLQTAGKLNTH